jgi:hypothetical protein
VRQASEHAPRKLLDFFDKDMLQLFDFERAAEPNRLENHLFLATIYGGRQVTTEEAA